MTDGLSASQRANGRGIIAAVKARGWPKKAAYIAVQTALAESGMRMLASANVPESQKYPWEPLSWTTDGLGHDHASMGMFQQQTGWRWTTAGQGLGMNQNTMSTADGWGTPAELMDAEKSTAKFLNALARVDWRNQAPWVAAQNVQHSAYDGNPRPANNFSSVYGGNYQSQHARAIGIVNALWAEQEEFTMDAEAKREIAALRADVAAVRKLLTNALTDNTTGGDGKVHNFAAIVRHVVKGAKYRGQK